LVEGSPEDADHAKTLTSMSKLCTALLLFVSVVVQAQVNYALVFKSGIQEETSVSSPEELDRSDVETTRFGGHYYVLVQFADIPDNYQRQQLSQQGVTLYSYVPHFAYIARIDQGASLESLPVRGIFPLQPHHKLSRSLLEGDYPIYALEGNNILLDLFLFPDIDPELVSQRLTGRGYTIQSREQSLQVSLPLTELQWLASQSYTLFLDISAPEPETEPDGLKARAMQRLNRLSRGPGEGLDGAGVTVAIGDDGRVDHPDINDRLIDLTEVDFGIHAEMTTGILAGSGNLDPMAMGMAPAATVKLLDIDGYPQIFKAKEYFESQRVVITSTSFGEGCGGLYTVNTRYIDDQVHENPTLLHVFSAGNNATFACSNRYANFKSPDGLFFGNISGGMKAGKNVLAVGNVELYDYLQIRSSRGPASDGRIKPDIVAMGQGQYTLGEDGAYQYGGGTSAAAPSLAGTAALLYQAYRLEHLNRDPTSDLIKGLLLNTADDLGRPGPDYEYGWGRVNGARALEALRNQQFAKGSIQHGETQKHTIQIPSGTGRVRAMIYWHDPAGSPLAGESLVNDLDMTMNTPFGKNILPWRLSTVSTYDSLTKPAWRAADHLNNVEQVTLDQPTPGTYTLTIKGHRLPQGPQDYVLVYFLEDNDMHITYPAEGEGLVPGEEVVVRWDALPGQGSFQLQYSNSGGLTWTTVSSNISAASRHLSWKVPDQATGSARLRLRRSGKSAISERFGIIGQPDFSVAYHDDDHAEMSWEAVPGATIYDIFQLQNGFMTKIGSTNSTSYLLPQKNAWESNWYSLCARNAQNDVAGRRAIAQKYVHRFCEREVTIRFRFDFYPAETTWEILAEDGSVLTSGGPYPGNMANQQIDITECLPSGCFTFKMYDAFGDGICCSSGDGYYQVLDEEGNLLAAGGKFDQEDAKEFCLSQTGELAVHIQKTQSIQCAGGNNGTLTAIVTGASGEDEYQWSNGQNTPTITGLKAGSYSVTVTAGNLTETAQYQLTDPDAVEITLIREHNQCAGERNGSINALVDGGTKPYTYQWSNGRIGTNLSDLSAGTYRLTVTDAANCVQVATATITQPTALDLTVNSQDPTCSDAANGQITVSVSGGQSPYTINWNSGVSGSNLTNLEGGNYAVTVTDSRGCTITETIRLTAPAPLTVQILQEEANCEQSAKRLRAMVQGGEPPYTMEWSDGSTGLSIDQPTRASYQVSVTDANGCQTTATVQLDQADALQLDVETQDPTCADINNGSVQLLITGGQQPYQYQWSNGASADQIKDLSAGTYRATVTDAFGCSLETVVTLRAPELLVGSLSKTDVSCAANRDGAIQLQISGGTPPYTYRWNDGRRQPSRSNLSPGLYRVTVTDANGCTWTEQTTLMAPSIMDISLSAVAVTCPGADDGQLMVAMEGGQPPYQLQWNRSVDLRNGVATGMTPGLYTLIVTDANGCSEAASVTVSEPDVLDMSLDVTQPGCGEDYGRVLPGTTGGTPPYSYRWSHGSRQREAVNLRLGAYQVTVSDANGCETTQSVQIERTGDLLVDLEVTQPSCPESRDGRLRVIASGGSGEYTYKWSAGGSLPVRSQLGEGSYDVTVSDKNGCTVVREAELQAPAAPEWIIDTQAPSCAGADDGRITIQLLGGEGPFTIDWSNGHVGPIQTGLSAGTYTFTITSGNGCAWIESVTLAESDPLVVDADITDVSCSGNTKGRIQASVSGGRSPYSWTWSHGATDADPDQLTPGTYEVTVTDANGCSATASFEVETAGDLGLTFETIDPACAGETNGFVLPVVSGGSEPYSYVWSNGASAAQLNDVEAGTYAVTITDANGCAMEGEVTLEAPAPLNVQGQVQHAGPGILGSVEVQTTGGQEPYSYAWNTGEASSARFNLEAGTYSVTVTDAAGCMDQATFTIEQSSDTYCEHYARSAEYEWIRGISIGNFDNESGIDRGYGNYLHQIIELKSGQEYDLTLRPGYGLREYFENWYIWIDLNGDRDFDDAGEQIVHVRERGDYHGTITLPALDHSITTRMRIAMRFLDDPNACGVFSYGEVEDYTVHLNAGEPTYCRTSGSVTTFDWIEAVSVNDTRIVSGDDGGYADRTSNPVTVDRDVPMRLGLTVGHNRSVSDQYWRVWIDFDRDGSFKKEEEVLAARAYETTLQANFSLPGGLQTGVYRMRVALRWGSAPDPCSSFHWGEVEDFALQVHQDAESWYPAIHWPSGNQAEQSVKREEVIAYPNPSPGGITLEWQAEEAWSGTCRVLDLFGRVVHQTEWNFEAGTQRQILSLDHLPPGTYRVQWRSHQVPVVISR